MYWLQGRKAQCPCCLLQLPHLLLFLLLQLVLLQLHSVHRLPAL
jgi:hypothetical protein